VDTTLQKCRCAPADGDCGMAMHPQCNIGRNDGGWGLPQAAAGGEAGYDEAAANSSGAVKLVTMALRQTAAEQ